MQKAIAIQGILGSFHHKVAQRYFDENVRVNECMSFGDLVKSMLSGDCDLGVMAIENSIAGSIIPNYALIDENHLKIIGEYFLPIHHNLMVLPGQTLREVKEVWSHPMALLQCRVFFDKNPQIKLVEDKDTAEVARRISQKKLSGVAAVASRKAAELYGLEIVAPEIQTINNNSTRFVILTTNDQQKPCQNINKASLKFILSHDRGSLATVLNVLNDCGLNLTKIQSLPIINLPWKYSFFADVTFSDEKHYRKAVSLLEIMASELTILGEYNTHDL